MIGVLGAILKLFVPRLRCENDADTDLVRYNSVQLRREKSGFLGPSDVE